MSFETNTMMNYESNNAEAAYELEIANTLGINDLLRAGSTFDIVATIPELIKLSEEVVGTPIVKTIPIGKSIVVVFDKFLVAIANFQALEKIQRNSWFRIYGSIEEVQRVHLSFQQRFPTSKKNFIDWYFAADKKPQKKNLVLSHKHEALDEFFPWIKPNLAQFQTAFLESDANVLLLIGEPGNGKTSFIRNLISRNDLSTAVTYDEELMVMDSFFIEFLNRSYDLLVIEDADTILRDRIGGNKVMSKLLNASDGLIETKKKIIFTANITQLDEIDPALIRPGRCFDILMFREMNRLEANTAARAAGIPEPDEARSLAQLFGKSPDAQPRQDLVFLFQKYKEGRSCFPEAIALP